MTRKMHYERDALPLSRDDDPIVHIEKQIHNLKLRLNGLDHAVREAAKARDHCRKRLREKEDRLAVLRAGGGA